jgi:hypothetical protein
MSTRVGKEKDVKRLIFKRKSIKEKIGVEQTTNGMVVKASKLVCELFLCSPIVSMNY